ncbi:MAG: trehalase family glycosidase [bacterium]
MVKNKIKDLQKYIAAMWDELTLNSRDGVKELDDLNAILYLPNDYVVPNRDKFDTMFYWDSYFTMLGFSDEGRHKLVKGVVENFFYEIENYNHTLNANKVRWATRSQSPYLTLMIKEVDSWNNDMNWLEKAYSYAQKEYETYWLNDDHKTSIGLSRYFDASGDDANHNKEYKTVAESGWDTTPRFDDIDVLNLVSIDLNCNLYQYEKDFSEFTKILGKKAEAENWLQKAEQRKDLINKYLWNEDDGLFYDYNVKTKEQKKIKSLAAYQSMFVGLATKEQAEKLYQNLKIFQTKGGVATTDEKYGHEEHQWSWPIIWAPLQWIVYKGLSDYGYSEKAQELALSFVEMVFDNWVETGEIWEKYNGETGNLENIKNRYPNQIGFGWTNGVVEHFIKLLY